MNRWPYGNTGIPYTCAAGESSPSGRIATSGAEKVRQSRVSYTAMRRSPQLGRAAIT